jgi:hypothetical protein
MTLKFLKSVEIKLKSYWSAGRLSHEGAAQGIEAESPQATACGG